ncbi:MAG: GxxExxY protein [Candidatus Kapabacteria bacterium]|jgi:GxxExxY protein|nr:GxxExxY protein [Candidatus Kapabacteria bacterium]
MIKQEYKYSELTSKIIGCAMTVHKTLGNGFTHLFYLFFKGIRECFAFQEVIYQRALEIEMREAGISFNREFEMPIFYREQQIGTRRVDFLVEGIISVELKATTKLEDVHFAQAINYLEAYNLEIGLLINFGETSLNFKRLTNKKFKSKQSQKSNKS